jgi:urea transporter/murein DD-endopeptidase MepM/ murein hydrolase activator NlpD
VNNLHRTATYWLDTLLHSYSQIFFSLDKRLAATLLAVTFFTPSLGLTAMAAVLTVNGMAWLAGLNREVIREGLFGFNAVFTGLFLGFYFQFNGTFVLLFLVTCALLLVTTVWLRTLFSAAQLPVLAFPFLITYWIVILSSGAYGNLIFSETNIYMANQLALLQQNPLYRATHLLNDLMPETGFLTSLLRTMAGTFFQTSMLGGLLVLTALLIASRISLMLALTGFASAYLFHILFGADLAALESWLAGANFIFMAIALGGFFTVPNRYSFLAVVLLSPILMLLMTFFDRMLVVFQLHAFTLSFSVLSLLFLMFLKNRWLHHYLELVTYQYYSPEKSIYKYLIGRKRFRNAHLALVHLPFWGEWFVSQGYDGGITHLGDWGKALDFEIRDDEGQTWKAEGLHRADYYCYDKPVVAPMDGFVQEITNNVEENEIGTVNTRQNWGNTIILNHQNGLFSQISHLRKDSYKVSVGEFVSRGAVLANCGNSGRSPYPHLHFQLQFSPQIGSRTESYPIAYFLERPEGETKSVLRVSDIPRQGSGIAPVPTVPLLQKALQLDPGMRIVLEEATSVGAIQNHGQTAHHPKSEPQNSDNSTSSKTNTNTTTWTVHTDAWNRTYLHCARTRSSAWFINDGTMFYFYDFEGDHHSLLFRFYSAAYRLLLTARKDLPITDELPLMYYRPVLTAWFQDILAPFYLFSRVTYTSRCSESDNEFNPQNVTIQSEVAVQPDRSGRNQYRFTLNFRDQQLNRFSIESNDQTRHYHCNTEYVT